MFIDVSGRGATPVNLLRRNYMMVRKPRHFNILASMSDDVGDRNEAGETPKTLPAAAKRALAEAEARRSSARETPPAPREIGGRGGKEPVRYGDWEVRGLATDF